MNPAFWDERYRSTEYAYGTSPNGFIAGQLPSATGGPRSRLIDLGAGEGRNAVFAASRGFDVLAVDQSEEGLRKTEALAKANGLQLDTMLADATTGPAGAEAEVVIAAFLHLPPQLRPSLYENMARLLVPGGRLIAEWFAPAQIERGLSSGGPKMIAMMPTLQELKKAFSGGTLLLLEEADVVLNEGPYHQGIAAVIRLVWQKA